MSNHWWGFWFYNPSCNSSLVCWLRETFFHPSQLAFWSCLDHPLYFNGNSCWMDLVKRKSSPMGENGPVSFCCTAYCQCIVEHCLFRIKKSNHCIVGHRTFDLSNCSNHPLVFDCGKDCRIPALSLFGLGLLCQPSKPWDSLL